MSNTNLVCINIFQNFVFFKITFIFTNIVFINNLSPSIFLFYILSYTKIIKKCSELKLLYTSKYIYIKYICLLLFSQTKNLIANNSYNIFSSTKKCCYQNVTKKHFIIFLFFIKFSLNQHSQSVIIHSVSKSVSHVHSILSTFIHFHQRSSTFINFHPLVSTFNPFLPLSSILIHLIFS